MQTSDDSIPVNDASRADVPVLTRRQVWQGLVLKAEDATKFVSVITYCKVLERNDDSLIRETNFGDGRMRERVTFFPEERVRFEQLDGPLQGGWIDNLIEEDATGGLRLRFVFGNPLGGGPGRPGGINTVYRQALESTLATVRRLVQEGKLP
jgi:hypothetical protein